MILAVFPKWWQTMKVAWSELLVYKTNFFLQIMGPALVFFFIKYSLWFSIFQGDFEKVIGNYTLTEMLTYHLWTMIIFLIGMGYNGHDLAEEIRMGRISAHLIYPFPLWSFEAARFLAQQVVQLLTAAITLFGSFVFFDWLLEGVQLVNLFKGLLLGGMVGVFWFTIQYATGLMAFWLEETWVLRVMIQMIAQFCSGAMVPLDLFPKWAADALNFTPFPYITYYPVKVIQGQSEDWISALGMLSFWTVVAAFGAAWIWSRGLRLYTASGM